MARECHRVPCLCPAAWKTDVVSAPAAISDTEALWGQRPRSKWQCSEKTEQIQPPWHHGSATHPQGSDTWTYITWQSKLSQPYCAEPRLNSGSTHSSLWSRHNWAAWTSDQESGLLPSSSSVDPTSPHTIPTHFISTLVHILFTRFS